MNLDTKLSYISQWSHKEATLCWASYHDKYLAKYNGALHTALMRGNVGAYIEREVRTFDRYARMWAYRRNLAPRTYTEFKPRGL